MKTWKLLAKVLVALALLVLVLMAATWEGARLARMQQSPQFHGGRFENTPPYVSNMSVLREPTFEVPVLKMSADDLVRPVLPGLRNWWLGHASVRIELDAVVIPHDHFDHLDMDTITHLARSGTQFYVGLGIGAHLERWQVSAAQIHEMDWWEQAVIKGATIRGVPA